MSGADFVINQTTKEFKWDNNGTRIDTIVNVDLPFLQGEIVGLADSINTRFYKEGFTDEQILTSNGEAADADNQINLYGDGFGLISMNLAVQSQLDATIRVLRTYEFGFEGTSSYTLLGAQNQRNFYENGVNVPNLLVSFDIVGSKLQIKVNPQGTNVNAFATIKICSV